MGNKPSLPEKVLSAVRRNDLCGFQALASSLTVGDKASSAARTAVLEHKDKKGRTPLLVAAAKNHYQILQQLIQLGADLHYINPMRQAAGSALHEAASRQHIQTVELLLAAGACPFVANAAGRTAVDEAVLRGHVGVVRAIEKYAEFSGFVAFKVRSMGGLASKFKARWAVLMPYFPYGSRDGGGRPVAHHSLGGSLGFNGRKPRRCLWLYKDRASIRPRCRLWVDGASVLTSGPTATAGTLRLHTSHGEPTGDLATTYSQGYCLSLRPVDLTPAAAMVYQRLAMLLNGQSAPAFPGTPQHQQQQQLQVLHPPVSPGMMPAAFAPAMSAPLSAGNGGGGVSAPNAASAPYPAAPPPSQPLLLPQPGIAPALLPHLPAPCHHATATATPGSATSAPPFQPFVPPPRQGPGGGSEPLSSPAAVAQATAAGPWVYSGLTLVYPGVEGPYRMAAPAPLHHQQLQQRLQQLVGTHASPAAVTTPRSRLQGVSPSDPGSLLRASPGDGAATSSSARSQRACSSGAAATPPPDGISQGEVLNCGGVKTPQKYRASSSVISAAAAVGSIQEARSQKQRDHSKAQSPSVLSPSSQKRQQQQQLAGGGGEGTSASAAAGSAADGLAAGRRQPGNTLQPPAVDPNNFHSDPGNGQVTGRSGAGTPGCGGGAAAAGPIRGVTTTTATTATTTDSMLPPTTPSRHGVLLGPLGTSPARTAAHQPPPPPPPQEEPEEDGCIICLNAPKEVGFLHGDSVHCCVCRECSLLIAAGAPCPLCRQPVERVLGIY